MKMQKVKLTSICQPKQWKTISTEELLPYGYAVYGANGKIGFYKEFNHKEPTIIITCRGATCGNIHVTESNSYINGNAMCLDSLSDTVLLKYLYYQLLNYDFKQVISGSAQPQITRENLSKVLIVIHDKLEQKVIAERLDKVSELIEKRKEQIKKLDLLIKSRFIEMFGDPEDNPKKWKKVGVSSVVQGHASNGFFAKRDAYIDNGNVAVLGVTHVVNRMYSQVDGLPRTNVTNDEIRKYKVGYGDMLFCRSSLVAEGIGKASIVPENTPENILFECHVIRLPLDLNKCVPEFMQVLSTMDYFRKQIIAQSKTATMTTIGQDGILNSEIVLPPIEKQKEFRVFVQQIDKSKIALQKGLGKLEILKKSLMQQYFG